MPPSAADDALRALLQALQRRGYQFITPTPLTHARVLARPLRQSPTLRDIFGWTRPFTTADLDAELLTLLRAGEALQPGDDGRYTSRLRASTLRGALYLHSAYPTVAADAVFFGPDTYRYADFVCAELDGLPAQARAVDIGCGSGAGALAAAAWRPQFDWTLVDINPAALRLAAVNAAHAGAAVTLQHSDVLRALVGDFDLLISNPPYVADPQHRAYRDGGDARGLALSLRIARESLARLRPGGRLLLYTGVAIIDGVDPLLEALQPLLEDGGWRWRYREIDPDVFGEELEQPAYADAERIAAVGLVVERQLEGG